MSLDIEKEVALTTITKLMEANNIKVNDLPEMSERLSEVNKRLSNIQDDYCKLIGIATNMYDYIKENSTEADAYEWACDHIDSYWRTELGICKPRMYRIAHVTIELDVAIPSSWNENADIEDYALQQDLSRDAEFNISIERDEISAEELERCEVYNRYIDDFEDSDFED